MNHSINQARIARITRMEEILDQTSASVSALTEALDWYQRLQPALQELSDYYSSPLWREDFEADEAGLLPADLKRGVLSEDGVWDLLTDHRTLIEKMKQLTGE